MERKCVQFLFKRLSQCAAVCMANHCLYRIHRLMVTLLLLSRPIFTGQFRRFPLPKNISYLSW